MKKKISKILGVGLSLALLTGLVAGLTPALAQDIKALTWGTPYQPGHGTLWSTSSTLWDTRWGTMDQINIVDMSVSADGTKVYTVCGTYNDQYNTYLGKTALHRVYTPSYGFGYMWSGKRILDEDGEQLIADDVTGTNMSIDLVAQAPDDSNVVAIAVSSDNVSTPPVVYFSTDGGTTWASLARPTDDTAGTSADTILCLDIGFLLGSTRFIMAGGEDGGVAGLWYFNLGGTIPSWVDAAAATGTWDTDAFQGAAAVLAAKFSPSFPSDRTAVIVTGPDASAATGTTVRIQLASFAGATWNSDFYGTQWEVAGPVYGREIEAITNTNVVLAATISMPSTYMASDETTRITFIGLATNETAVLGNIYRFDDEDRTRLLGDDADDQVAIRSVAINSDGDKLVAGEWANNNVIRSANPLVNEPDCRDASSVKRPGGNDDTNQVIVAWGGTSVKAGSSGYNSAFSVSADDGNCFNDLGMIDSDVLNIEDFYMPGAGGLPYIVTNDGTNLSVWKQSPYSTAWWTRILVLDDDTGYIIRVAPEDNNVVYLGRRADERIYYSSDGGECEWLRRFCGVAVQDMAVESADVVYAINTVGKVSTSTDGGFVWSQPATDCKQSTSHTIISMGVDQLLVSSKTGGVSYSKDGSATWTSMVYTIGSGETQVAAEGFETGDNVYAARSNSNLIYRWTFGTNSTTWTTIGELDTAADEQGFFGLLLVDGVLYGASCNATGDAPSYMFRHLNPDLPEDQVDVYWDEQVNTTAAFSVTPQALRIDTNGCNMVWAIDNNSLIWYLHPTYAGTYPQIWRYEDSLACTGPTLALPADGSDVPANRETGIGYNVILTWEQQSRATGYEVDVAYDADFTQVLVDGAQVANADLLDTVIQSTGGLTLQLVPGITYYWRVRAAPFVHSTLGSLGPMLSPWSETWSFTVQTLTAAQQAIQPVVEEEVVLEPVIIRPAFGADEVSVKPTFTWTAVAGCTYEFVLAEELDRDDPFEIIDYSATCDINAHVARDTLIFSTTYHWRVRAICPDATGEWVRGIFTTAAAPVEPPAPIPPVIIEEKPAPEIILQVPATPAPVQVIPDWALWTIVAVGAVLVIAVIVLIVRTRRVV